MSQSSRVKLFTEDEIAVTEILIGLRKLISLSEYLTDFNWGCKRRRSCLDESTEYQIEDRKAVAAVSPTTPLSFSPTESDDTKTSNLRKDNNIERLTQTKDSLTREVENAKKHYQKLKAYNSELKAMKQEVMNNKFPRKEKTQDNRITDPTAQQIPIGLYSSSNGAGPLGIDLNIPAVEEAYYYEEEPLDGRMAIAEQRARSAEARRLRRGLMKAKSMRNNKNNAVLQICQQPDDYQNGVF